MECNDRDGSDPAVGVGLTATEAAAARDVAGRRKAPLVNDSFAKPLVRAVGDGALTRLAQLSGADDESGFAISRMVDWIAARSRFFDDYVNGGQKAGFRQTVLLGAGLDSRAYRFSWLSGATMYEVDQPGVLEFKNTTLPRLQAVPSLDRRPVAADLRGDWVTPLRNNGFDPAQRTVWSAEGLLAYLPAEDQMGLLDEIAALSTTGSWLAADTVDDVVQLADRVATSRGENNPVSQRAAHLGSTTRTCSSHAVAQRLRSHGWAVTRFAAPELLAAYALPPLGDCAQLYQQLAFVGAVSS